jgi:NAD(P)H-dependent FMN reductase
MPQGHLETKACLALQTAGVPNHSLAVEYGLYPLFRSLDGTPVGAVYATDAEFVDGAPTSELAARLEAAAAAALRLATA